MASVTCEPCKARSKESTSVRWCIDCEESLCSDCTESHQAMKVSRNHQLIDVAQMPAQVNIPFQLCLSHEELPFEYFCIDHDALCCKECLAEIHRSCHKVMSVDIAAKGAKQSHSFLDNLEVLDSCMKTSQSLNNERKQRIQHVEDDVKLIKDSITEAKMKMIQFAESLEEALLDDLKYKKDAILSKINKTITESEKIQSNVKEQLETFQLVQKHGSDKQAFFIAHASKTILAKIEETLESLTDEACNQTIAFEENKLVDVELSFGTLKLKENPSTVKFQSRKRLQSQIPITESRKLTSISVESEIDFKMVDGTTFVTGMTFDENKMLILCDYSNLRILVYNEKNKYQYHIETKYFPWGVALIPGTNTVVASSYSDESLQWIDLNMKKVVKVMKINGSNTGGVAASKEHVYIGSQGSIHILQHGATIIKTLKVKPEKDTPWFISLGRNGQIYYSTSLALFCINQNGTQLFSYSSSNLQMPRTMTTDNCGNIYVIGSDSSNLHRLKSDGILIKIILNENDGLMYPISFCFNNDYTKLYVSNRNGTAISVYNIN